MTAHFHSRNFRRDLRHRVANRKIAFYSAVYHKASRLSVLPLTLLPLIFALASPAPLHAQNAPKPPPTLDPTYGLEVPKPIRSKAPRTSDARWIWTERTADAQTIALRGTFDLPRSSKNAILYVTADDYFTVYVNGKQVDGTVPDPKDTFVWKHVHRKNVTSMLHVGKNVIAIKATNAGGAAGAIARLEADDQPIFLTGNHWKALDSATPSPAWNTTNFDDSKWAKARVIGDSTAEPWAGAGGLENWPGYDTGVPYLAHISLPPADLQHIHNGDGKIEITAGYADIFMTPARPASNPGENDPPSLLVDFGKEIAGRVEISSPGGEPFTVIVGTGESAEEAVKSPWGGTHNLAALDNKPVYTPYSAFRYAQLVFPVSAARANSAPPRIHVRIQVDHKYYPVEYKGSFACSDELLNRIWYTGAYTAHLCMQEDIWDAPKRDRARWMGDLHVAGAVINLAFADKFLMEQTMQRLRDEAQGGNLASAMPKQHVNGIPGYSCSWICGLADFHRHIGDYAYLNRQHDALITMLEYLKSDTDGRDVFANVHKAWPFVDWAPEYNQDSLAARSATHLFLVKAVREAVFLLYEMGDSIKAKAYDRWADSLTDAAQRNLLDIKTGTFGDRRQENAMAIYAGVATPRQTQTIYERVLTPASPAWNAIATPYYNNYVIYAMSQAGHTPETLDVIRKYWGGMLAAGATSWWEAYDPKWEKKDFHAHLEADNGKGYFVSLAHAWSAGPTSWLTERILGVRPTTGGFKTVDVAPELGDLQWAEGDVPTPQGILHIRADKANKTDKTDKQADGLILKARIPAGVTAALTVPGNTIYATGPREVTLSSPNIKPPMKGKRSPR